MTLGLGNGDRYNFDQKKRTLWEGFETQGFEPWDTVGEIKEGALVNFFKIYNTFEFWQLKRKLFESVTSLWENKNILCKVKLRTTQIRLLFQPCVNMRSPFGFSGIFHRCFQHRLLQKEDKRWQASASVIRTTSDIAVANHGEQPMRWGKRKAGITDS